jgi:TAP-like protein
MILSRLMPVPPKIVILSAPAHVTSVFERYHDQIRLSLSARERFNERIKRVTGYSASEASLADNDLSLKTETLLIHDIQDREVPFRDFEELQKNWKNSRFLATNGLGHRRILRDESVAHQIIDFLQAKSANK